MKTIQKNSLFSAILLSGAVLLGAATHAKADVNISIGDPFFIPFPFLSCLSRLMAPGTSIGPHHAIMVMVVLGLSGGIMIHLLRGGTVETTRFATARLPMVTTENRDIAEIMVPLRHPGT